MIREPLLFSPIQPILPTIAHYGLRKAHLS